jgi:ATP-binding cassette subfamily C (CFTR/MRP) protein 2
MNIVLAKWSLNSTEKKETDFYYLKLYTAVSLLCCLFIVVRTIFVYFSSIVASIKMHKKMCLNLIFAPLNEFFERVMLGRILNRFSKDL